MAVKKELVDELLKDADPKKVFGSEGVLDDIKKMVTIYSASLDVGVETGRLLRQTLGPDELRRSAEFARPELSRRYEIAHGVLRLVLGRHTGRDPRAISFASVEREKPVLCPHFGSVPVEFNLSHSGHIACVALSSFGRIGADVEVSRDVDDAAQLSRSILSPQEARVAEMLVDAGRATSSAVLLRCWAMKEAVLKAVGSGLYISPLDVHLDPDALRDQLAQGGIGPGLGRPAIVSLRPSSTDGGKWLVCPFDLNGAVGAFAVEREGLDFSVRFSELTERDIQLLLASMGE